MIDVENQIYTLIADALTDEFPGISVSGTTIFQPSVFPYVCIEEADSSTALELQDSSLEEQFAEVMYEVNVYSNKEFGSKAECKEILNLIDDIMFQLNAHRINRTSVPMDDASKHRMVSRYRLIVGKNEKLYRS